MSIPAFAWAIQQGREHELCSDDRCLLMVLANMASVTDGQLSCWPLLATLTTDTGLPKRTLIRCIARLEAAGLIRTEARGRGQTYYIEWRSTGATVAPNKHRNGAKSATNKAANGATRAPIHPTNGATVAPIRPGMVPNLHATGAKSAREWCHGGTQNLKRNLREETSKGRTPPTPPQAEGVCINHPQFATFWQMYPRKVGRRTASGAFDAAVRRAGCAETILAGLQRQQFADDPRYIPHPSTWLRGDRWTDEQLPPRRSVLDQIRADWNLPTFLAPALDDEPDDLRRLA